MEAHFDVVAAEEEHHLVHLLPPPLVAVVPLRLECLVTQQPSGMQQSKAVLGDHVAAVYRQEPLP